MDYEEKERSAINSTDKKDRESNKIIDEANRVSECDSKVIRKRQVELIEERRRRLDEFIKAKNLSKELGKKHSSKIRPKLSPKSIKSNIFTSTSNIKHSKINFEQPALIKRNSVNLTVTQKICYLDDNLIKKNNYKRSVSNLDEEIPLIDIEVKNSPGSEKIPQKSINVRLKMVHSDVLDWKRPVYLKCDSKLKRISRPKISFFKLSQVEFLFSSGNIKLAQMMMVVLSAPNQPQRMSSEYASKYTELVSLLFPQLSTFKSNGMRTPLKLSHISSPSFKTIKVEVSSILKPSLSLDSSPHTPELKNSTMMALCGRSSSFDTNYSDVKTMAMEIDDIIRRNHGILEDVVQKIDSKNSENLIAKAASSLKEISAENRFNSKLIYPRSELRRKSPPMNKGSQFVFGLVTPSKRVRDELDSTAVISPIRRSMRIKNNEKYYENLNEIPNLSEHGFLPNPSIPLVRKKAGPGQNIKSINYKGETKR